jgi:hypothetical protein
VVVVPQTGTDVSGKNCDAGAAQFAVGQAPTPAVIESIRRATNAQLIRVLPEGTPTTREYLAGRVNAQLDGFGRIAAVTCG